MQTWVIRDRNGNYFEYAVGWGSLARATQYSDELRRVVRLPSDRPAHWEKVNDEVDHHLEGKSPDEVTADLLGVSIEELKARRNKDPNFARDNFAADYDDKPAGPRERLKRNKRER